MKEKEKCLHKEKGLHRLGPATTKLAQLQGFSPS